MRPKRSLYNIVEEIPTTRTVKGEDGISRQVPSTYKQKVFVATVSAGTRIGHHIIDSILSMIAMFVMIIPMVLLPESVAFLAFPLIIFAVPAYYCLTEFYFQQTIGKMATGCVVINQYAEKPDFGTCVKRTFSRIVPFEPWSCLLSNPSRGWHDEWSDTWVVSKYEAERLKEIVIKHNWDLTGVNPKDHL